VYVARSVDREDDDVRRAIDEFRRAVLQHRAVRRHHAGEAVALDPRDESRDVRIHRRLTAREADVRIMGSDLVDDPLPILNFEPIALSEDVAVRHEATELAAEVTAKRTLKPHQAR